MVERIMEIQEIKDKIKKELDNWFKSNLSSSINGL